EKPPPIVLHGKYEYKKLLAFCKEGTTQDVCLKFTKNNTIIITQSVQDFNILKEGLKTSKKTQWHTYATKGERTHGFVIYGLDNSPAEADVKQDLEEKGINCKYVYKMKNTNSPLYVVITDNKTTLRDLESKAKTVEFVIVKWKKLINSRKIIQCHKCQVWGHAASNCHANPKCLKCAKDHLTSDCTLKKENKKQTLEIFLEKFKPHILVITETKLINSDKITFRNYTLTRQDRNNNKNTRGGGVLIAVRKGVPYTSKKTPNTSLETAAIQLADNGPAIVGAYNPPYNYFKVSELSKILAISNKTILAGDLNAKNTVWNCNSNETNGITLEKYLNSSGTSINFPNEPTHTPLNGTNPTTIDIFLAKNIQNYTRARTLNDLNSDHSPVCMETTYDGLEDVSRRITSFKNTDWTKFRSDINRAIKINSNIGTIEKLNSEITKFTSILVEMSKKHSKEVDPTFRLQIPDDITQLMKERNKIRKIYQRTGASEDKNLMTKHNEEIKNRLEIHKRKFWNNKLKKLNTKDNSLWKMAKSLKKNRNELPPLQLVNGDEAVTDKEKAEALVSHFQSIHQDLFSISTPEQDRIDTENYYKSWKLKINESKTENIIFARKRTNINILSKLRVGDHQITPSKSVKYLGLQLDPRLNFKKHIHSSINKGNAALRTLYPLLAKNSGLGQENKVLIYKQIIRPIITYGAPIWSHISNYALNPIEIFQNKCLRLAANASRFTRIRDLYHFTGVGSIREFTTNLAEAFFNRHYNNPLITDILKKNARHKHKLLHTHLDL
ncbi:unnamed protein product, partial [Tenebrio molitor]